MLSQPTPPSDVHLSPPPVKRSSGWKGWLRVVGSVTILAVIATRLDWPQVGQTFRQMNVWLWVFGVVLYALTQVVSSVRWQILSANLGIHRPLGVYVRGYFLGMFFNLVLPTSVGGDVVRAIYLGNGTKRGPALLSVFADRLSGLLVLLALGCLAVAIYPHPLPWWLGPCVWGMTLSTAAGLCVLPWLPRLPLVGERVRQMAVSIPRAVALGVRPGPLSLSLVVQGANVLLVWLIGRALGLAVPDGYYAILVPVVTLLTLLPVSVNGMGVREGGCVLLLAPLGIPTGSAITLSFLWFLAFTAVSLMGAPLLARGTKPSAEVGSPHAIPDDRQPVLAAAALPSLGGTTR